MKRTIGVFLTLVCVAMLFFATASPSWGQVPFSSEVWAAGAYCTDEESALQLAKAMVDGGAVGYGVEIMASETRCYDVVALNRPRPTVILLEQQWRIVTLDGQAVDFWTAVDTRGNVGWVWFFLLDSI